jgi:hypothetical protein
MDGMSRSRNWLRFFKLLTLAALLLGARNASLAATLRFDELGTDALIDVNGLYVQNVHFGFSPDQAFFNQIIGTDGFAVLSIDPVLTGPTTGALTIAFDAPTTLLRFDILMQSIFTIDDSNLGPNGGPAYTVLLSNGMTLSGSTTPQQNGVYSEGEFVYSGDAIDNAVISFFSGTDAGGSPVLAFGLDNLTYDAPESSAPEPPTIFGLGAGLLAILALKQRCTS